MCSLKLKHPHHPLYVLEKIQLPMDVITVTQRNPYYLGRHFGGVLLSCVRLFATPWTVAYKALPSVGFSRQEYWSGLPFPSPGDLPDPGIEPVSLCIGRQILNHWPPRESLVQYLKT